MGKDKVQVLHVKHNKNIDVFDCDTEGDRLKIKDRDPQFTSECIFNIKQTSSLPLIGRIINRHRKRKQAIIFLDGKPFCEKLRSSQDLIEPLTDEDRKRIVKKEIAKTLGTYQMMKPWMFVILALLLGVSVILEIAILRGVRLV